MTAVGVAGTSTGPIANTSRNRWIALTGVLFSVVLAVSIIMTGAMPDATNAAKVQAWDIKNKNQMSLATVITVAAVIIGLYFLTWLHSQLTRERTWMSTLSMAGIIIFAASGAVAAGLSAIIGQDAKHLSTDSLQLMASVTQNLSYPMTAIGLSVMYLGFGFLIRRSELLPNWLGYAAWVFAFCSATFVLGFFAFIGTALWLIVVGIYLAARPSVEG